ncbi:MAG: hypothetical protein IPP71_03270 [Bacteroidetes bacterium]|nr:hypothetical protein [Bacteroidota bacterium]
MTINDVVMAGIRHSCFPNCAYSFSNELVFIDEVAPGDKITVDFSTLFTGHAVLFRCNCGCNGCRINILGFDQLPVYFQEKYLRLGMVPRETLKSIDIQINTTKYTSSVR